MKGNAKKHKQNATSEEKVTKKDKEQYNYEIYSD